MVIRATLERISEVSGNLFKPTITSRRLLYLVIILWACVPRVAWSQTPSPLQEWQYSSGIALEKLFEPNLADWDVVLGAGGEYKPLYDGAELTRKQAGPVISIRYKDIAFASVGEGLGINLIHGRHYRGGIALGYDLGRLVSNDVGHLHGLGDIGRAPVLKAFASYALSKSFPLVVRGDIREILGGADGMLADLDVYLPLPGSSRRVVMLAGPSFTYADHRYMQKVFGVTAAQSIASGYPVYDAHAGSDAVGFGFSATGFITDHWLINMDAAVNRLLGSTLESPITQKSTQHALGLSVAYSW
ncbi:MAG TPA: MipA/OmpV family protein [Steroidobacteraceae bacterium]|jgi:outer membrane scaffolding protein for murein synthesis (MipA/OmpV family)